MTKARVRDAVGRLLKAVYLYLAGNTAGKVTRLEEAIYSHAKTHYHVPADDMPILDYVALCLLYSTHAGTRGELGEVVNLVRWWKLTGRGDRCKLRETIRDWAASTRRLGDTPIYIGAVSTSIAHATNCYVAYQMTRAIISRLAAQRDSLTSSGVKSIDSYRYNTIMMEPYVSPNVRSDFDIKVHSMINPAGITIHIEGMGVDVKVTGTVADTVEHLTEYNRNSIFKNV